jgi:hypothetical protein
MRDVDDVQKTENDREAERDQGHDQSPDQSVYRKRENDRGHQEALLTNSARSS